MANKIQPRKELGRGWAFPIRLERKRFAMVEGNQDVKEAVRIVLGTQIGERIMRPQFGSEVPSILFEPKTAATADRLRNAIFSALERWEPRIDVLEVDVSPDPEVETRIIASLTYRLRENNSILNLVFPFYLKEGAEEI